MASGVRVSTHFYKCVLHRPERPASSTRSDISGSLPGPAGLVVALRRSARVTRLLAKVIKEIPAKPVNAAPPTPPGSRARASRPASKIHNDPETRRGTGCWGTGEVDTERSSFSIKEHWSWQCFQCVFSALLLLKGERYLASFSLHRLAFQEVGAESLPLVIFQIF